MVNMAKKMTKIILKALIDQDLTITELARRIGRSRVYTSNVINYRFNSLPVETLTLIAKELKIPVEELLPNGNNHKRAA